MSVALTVFGGLAFCRPGHLSRQVTENTMEQGEPYPNARRAVQKGVNVINIYDGPDIFLKTFAQVRREVGLLYATAFCQVEVCNGGLSQFFGNSTGVLAPEAVEGFIAIGQPQTAVNPHGGRRYQPCLGEVRCQQGNLNPPALDSHGRSALGDESPAKANSVALSGIPS
jgi:uncharacterized protein DUF4375